MVVTTVAANTAELVNFQKPSMVLFPFRLRPTLDASWTTWNTEETVKLWVPPGFLSNLDCEPPVCGVKRRS